MIALNSIKKQYTLGIVFGIKLDTNSNFKNLPVSM